MIIVLLFKRSFDIDIGLMGRRNYATTVITYLGSVVTNKKNGYKIIAIKDVWGPNKHTNGFIYMFDTKNNYVGRYVLGDARDLPVALIKNELIFTNRDKDCKQPVRKVISFWLGIPQQLFIPACDGRGDIYKFTTQ